MAETKAVETRNGSPEFYKIAEQAQAIHHKKSHDYANDENPYGNYTFSGELAALFKHDPSQMGFLSRIGEKYFRLANLEASGKTPNNESIEDTEIDLVTITMLWMAYRRERRQKSDSASREQIFNDLHDRM